MVTIRLARTWLPALLALSLGVMACGLRPATTPPAPAAPAITDSRSVILQGREFILYIVESSFEVPARSGNMMATKVLVINGDDRHVSFASSAPTLDLQVAGSTITFGGHTFEPESAPGSYLVDGTAVPLIPGPIHVFNDGQYEGTASP